MLFSSSCTVAVPIVTLLDHLLQDQQPIIFKLDVVYGVQLSNNIVLMQQHKHNARRNDHTIMRTPHPVCSVKLSMIWLGSYYGGGPRWNTQCCSFLFGSIIFILLQGSQVSSCGQAGVMRMVWLGWWCYYTSASCWSCSNFCQRQFDDEKLLLTRFGSLSNLSNLSNLQAKSYQSPQ